MKKLVELLNEYQYGMFVYENDLLLLRLGSHFKVGGETFIISKQFGFIKWLVENDKIDLGQKLFNLTKNDSRKSTICDLDNNDFSWEDTFLMLLAISDTPIEDLISYLK